MPDEADIAQRFIEASIEEAMDRRTKQSMSVSLTECAECGEEIPEARRVALPGVQLCVWCQEVLENGS